MKLTVPTLSTDERAVSPVIGVILMVAVTVLLGAIVSMLVLDMGSDIDPAPQASFGFEMNSSNASNVIITHEGGDKMDANDLSIRVGDAAEQDWSTGDDVISAGDSIEVAADSGDVVRVIWSNNGDTAVVARYTVP